MMQIGLAGESIPLSDDDFETLRAHIAQFADAHKASRPRGGFLPDRYLTFDATLEFDKRVEESTNLTRQARLERLKNAQVFPSQHQTQVTVFERNPDVIAEVLYQANGKCQRCGADAPFKKRTNGQPYLEVHHKIPLMEDGPDNVENAIALCPNCHREMHHGNPIPLP